MIVLPFHVGVQTGRAHMRPLIDIYGQIRQYGLFVPKPTRDVACHHSFRLTCLVASVDVRWRPLVYVTVVTHLVTHPPRGGGGVHVGPHVSTA
jgi:hypothetical protein